MVPTPPRPRPTVDRRNQTTRQSLLARILGEFSEMPCLRLTRSRHDASSDSDRMSAIESLPLWCRRVRSSAARMDVTAPYPRSSATPRSDRDCSRTSRDKRAARIENDSVGRLTTAA